MSTKNNMNQINLGVIMDPLESINIKKDSTYAMLKEAARRGWNIHCCTPGDIYTSNSKPHAHTQLINISNNNNKWYEIKADQSLYLGDLDILLLRKDPPFNMEYIYLTYILELLEQQAKSQNKKLIIANNPKSVRDNNEKFSTLYFPEVTPPSLVTANKYQLIDFIKQQEVSVIKPLDGMGGKSIFKINYGDDNTSVILDTVTNYGTNTILAQKFIPEITKGDKRILLINGEPIPFGLARIPAEGEFRGNIAAGAKGVGFKLTDSDLKIFKIIGPKLRQQGLYFVGIDVIGEYLTEINVTSPTCIQELDTQFDLNISATYLDCLYNKLQETG